jgi:S1-C subfamily serine protease
VSGLEPGNYLVRVVAHGYAPSPAVAVTVEAPPAPAAEADFTLTAGGTLFGLVYDADGRAPIADARVSTEGSFGSGATVVPMVASVTTDGQGRFELRGLAPGLHAATAAASGYHGRISSSFQIQEGQRVGPMEFALTPLKDDEEPKVELAGIGAVLAIQKDAMVIGRVIPGGGAEEAGLVTGDAILKIEGERASDLGFQGAILKIRGPEGSRVLLTIRRAGGEVVDMMVYRRRIRG